MKKFQALKHPTLLVIGVFLMFSRLKAEEIIKLGTTPIIWFAQPAVIIGEAWDKDLGFTLEHKKYPGPAHLLQAFVQGELDGMNNNIAASIITASKGIEVKLVSGTIIGDINLLSHKELIDLKNSFGQIEAIKKFYAIHQRKLRLVTNPKGSLSDLNSRYWIKTNFPDYKNFIEIIHAGDQAQLQQLYIMGQADLLAGFVPIKEIISQKQTDVDYFLGAKELMENQPGGALTMRSSYVQANLERIVQLKNLYKRATDLMKSDPKRCSLHIEKYLLRGLLKSEVIEKALIENRDYLDTDLNLVRNNTQEIQNLMLEENYIKTPVDLNSLFK